MSRVKLRFTATLYSIGDLSGHISPSINNANLHPIYERVKHFLSVSLSHFSLRSNLTPTQTLRMPVSWLVKTGKGFSFVGAGCFFKCLSHGRDRPQGSPGDFVQFGDPPLSKWSQSGALFAS